MRRLNMQGLGVVVDESGQVAILCLGFGNVMLFLGPSAS